MQHSDVEHARTSRGVLCGEIIVDGRSGKALAVQGDAALGENEGVGAFDGKFTNVARPTDRLPHLALGVVIASQEE